MRDFLKGTRQKVLISLVAAGIFCLVFNLVIVLALAVRDLVVTRRLTQVEEIKKLEQNGVDYFSSVVFFDSILNVVQNYYVDAERIKYPDLLKKMVEALSPHPEVHVTRSARNYFIEVNEQRIAIPHPTNLTYEDLLMNMAKISKHLQMYLRPHPSAKIGLTRSAESDSSTIMVINALLSSLDAHSLVLSNEAYQDLRQGTEGAFGGLGVLVGIRDQLLTVIKPLPRSPALRGGVKRNDRIIHINGVNTFGYTLDDLVEYMRGAPGTSVDLSIMHDGDMAPRSLSLVREVIKVDSVTSKDIVYAGKKLLYLMIENFSSQTSLEVEDAMDKFRARNGGVLAGLLLDLRSNPGGLLDQAVQVSDLFLDSGEIVITKGRHREAESARMGKMETNFPIAVLINEESASASEIVAGALQDHGRAVVIGQPSFGKGSVQTIFELTEERALKLTVARYYTPAGRSIQNVGIVPDVWMQPIFKNADNQNLLGSYRYRNESFLANHLDSESSQPNPSLAFKGYFLKAAPQEGQQVESSVDVDDLYRDKEFVLALDFLTTVVATYPQGLPEGARRASHWLALASKTITSELKSVNQDAQRWLAANFSVQWQSAEKPSKEPSPLILQLRFNQAKSYAPGEDVDFTWAIHNPDSVDVANVSLFVTSLSAAFEPQEKLIGMLPGNTKLNGKLRLKLPSQHSGSYLNLMAGLAVGGQAKKIKDQFLSVRLRNTPDIKFRSIASLTSEVGGKIAGALEPSERAKLKLRLFNDSSIDLRDVKTKIHNLSGKQIKILARRDLVVPAIEAHKWADVYVDIVAAERLASDKIEFGVQLQCQEVFSDWKKEVNISGLPNVNKQKTVGTVAH